MIRLSFVPLLLTLVSGCGAPDCASKSDANARDWCYHDRALAKLKDGQLDPALADVGAIESPLVRAFATNELLAAGPKGMTASMAQTLCDKLPHPNRDSCEKTWTRPHLWTH